MDGIRPDVAGSVGGVVGAVNAGRSESPLRWTCKSTRRWRGVDRSRSSGRLPHGGGLLRSRLQPASQPQDARRKQHPDRNAQFEFINAQVPRFQKRRQPVISVDTKKKELVGDFKNGGREWRPEGEPEEVRVHDFQDKDWARRSLTACTT